MDELPRALESAWRLNRHSVVEVRPLLTTLRRAADQLQLHRCKI